MSATKEVRFSAENMQRGQQSAMVNISSRSTVIEKKTQKTPSLARKSFKNIMKSIPPPPPPPPPPKRNISATPITMPKRSAKSAPPPPPPPPPRRVKIETERTPAKPEAVSKKDGIFSPSNIEHKNVGNEMLLSTPVLTILSPMSGVTNFTTDFRSPSLSNHRKRNTTLLDTTLNSIDMLNFEYIESCDCIPDLQRIIRLLSESKNKSPQLMKATMKRLFKLQQNEIMSPNNGDKFAEGAANLSRITTANTTLDSFDPTKTSLNFSLSPSSTLHGVDLIETPKTAGRKIFDHGNQFIDRRLGPIEESPVPSKEYCVSYANSVHNSSNPENTPSKLTHRKQVKGVSPQMQSSRAFVTTQQIQQLKISLNEKNSDNEELKAAICEATREHDETKRALNITRATLSKKDKETRALEERLEMRITELSRVLASTAERSKLVVEGERTFRRQCEEELRKENKKNTLLNQELKETRNNLEKLQRRHSSFRVELLKVTGLMKTERPTLSQDEFVAALSKKIQAMKEDNDNMRETLKEAKKAIEQRDDVDARMDEAIQLNQKLALENQRLCRKINELRAEVKSSRAYIDKLLSTSHEKQAEDWEKHEQQYKRVIQNLRKQIRKQDTVVSLDLYKIEKGKVREKATQLRVAESTIDDLQAKVAQLQVERGVITETKRPPFDFNQRHSAKTNPQTPKNQVEELTPKQKFWFDSEPTTRAGSGKKGDDLTGITIAFQTSPEFNNTNRSRKASPKSGNLHHRPSTNAEYTTENLSRLTRQRGGKVLGEITMNSQENTNMRTYAKCQMNGNVKQSASRDVFNTNNVSRMGKENSMTPKKSSRGSPLRLVRNFGGRSALKNKIKKMRSPKMSSPTMMGGQVQVIMH